MALSKSLVKKACKILKQMNPSVSGCIKEFDPRHPPRTNRIYGIAPKSDGGWFAIFIFVESMTLYQWQLWNTLKQTIYATSMKPEITPPLTRIGFY